MPEAARQERRDQGTTVSTWRMNVGRRIHRLPRRRYGGGYALLGDHASIERRLYGSQTKRTVGNADCADMRVDHAEVRVEIIEKRDSRHGEVAFSAGELKECPSPCDRPTWKMDLGDNLVCFKTCLQWTSEKVGGFLHPGAPASHDGHLRIASYRDSRHFGVIEIEKVVARVLFVCWPLERFGRVQPQSTDRR